MQSQSSVTAMFLQCIAYAATKKSYVVRDGIGLVMPGLGAGTDGLVMRVMVYLPWHSVTR